MSNIEKILLEREEFLVIGLTGRVGSGCSEAADIFQSGIQELQLPAICPGDRGLVDDEERDRRVLIQYFNAHWLAFDLIQTRTVITSFLLKDFQGFAKEFLKAKEEGKRIKEHKINIKKEEIDKELDNLENRVEKLLKWKRENISIQNISDAVKRLAGEMSSAKKWNKYDDIFEKGIHFLFKDKSFMEDIEKLFKKFYREILPEVDYFKYREYCENANQILYDLSAAYAYYWFQDKKSKGDSHGIWDELQKINRKLEKTKTLSLSFDCFMFVHDLMPAVASAIHELLAKAASSDYTQLYQKYGNCIRKYGEIRYNHEKERGKNAQEKDIFSIPRKMNQFIKVLRHPFDRSFVRPTRIVIDSIKNTFETVYLRERYSAFYLFAISAEEPIRIKRLMEGSRKRLNLSQIHFIDWNEYSFIGKDIYTMYKDMELGKGKNVNKTKGQVLSDDEIDFAQNVMKINSVFSDLVRKEAYENGTHQFVLQDVASCIQDADVFISNKGFGETTNQSLKWEIVRNVCLILYPGLVQPTPIERCMQIAFSAKANSGCLSRQVGAVVTDSKYNILSIGWNDVPCGDVSCSRKNLIDLYRLEDTQAYTEYELKNNEFRDRIQELQVEDMQIAKRLCGLPLRYCFKDIHSDKKNPMRSRAMHGEEKALATCGKECENGFLFTTSSPCEMCSKNAKNHKIKCIYYIEPYPGISEDQYSRSGDKENVAKHILFTGAIGRAYTQMYTPIMPHKDILRCMGIYDEIGFKSK